MSKTLIRLRKTVGTGRVGRWIIGRAVCESAPYFKSIRPRIEVFDPGHVEVSVKKRRPVTNHIGTMHAIVMCNMAELAGGSCCALSVPDHMRWIPVGMEVEYLKLAKTDLRSVCQVDPSVFHEVGDHEVPVLDVLEEHHRTELFLVHRFAELQLLDAVELLDELPLAGVAESPQKCGGQELAPTPAAIEVDVKKVVGVKLHLEP